MKRFVQIDVFFNGIPMPGYVSRALLFYLLCPALTTKQLQEREKEDTMQEKDEKESAKLERKKIRESKKTG